MEISVSSQPVRMLWIISFSFRREEAEIPVFGDVPVEGVERVQENEKQPNRVSQFSKVDSLILTIAETVQPRSYETSLDRNPVAMRSKQ